LPARKTGLLRCLAHSFDEVAAQLDIRAPTHRARQLVSLIEAAFAIASPSERHRNDELRGLFALEFCAPVGEKTAEHARDAERLAELEPLNRAIQRKGVAVRDDDRRE